MSRISVVEKILRVGALWIIGIVASAAIIGYAIQLVYTAIKGLQ